MKVKIIAKNSKTSTKAYRILLSPRQAYQRKETKYFTSKIAKKQNFFTSEIRKYTFFQQVSIRNYRSYRVVS